VNCSPGNRERFSGVFPVASGPSGVRWTVTVISRGLGVLEGDPMVVSMVNEGVHIRRRMNGNIPARRSDLCCEAFLDRLADGLACLSEICQG